MIAERLRRHLEEKHVSYTHHAHRAAYTAQEVAAEEHVPGRMMAKTLVAHTGEGFVLVVLPAPLRLDLGALRAGLGKPQARLATEAEFAGLFPDSETGAMPPFGNLYGLPVYVDEALARIKTRFASATRTFRVWCNRRCWRWHSNTPVRSDGATAHRLFLLCRLLMLGRR